MSQETMKDKIERLEKEKKLIEQEIRAIKNNGISVGNVEYGVTINDRYGIEQHTIRVSTEARRTGDKGAWNEGQVKKIEKFRILLQRDTKEELKADMERTMDSLQKLYEKMFCEKKPVETVHN